MATPVPQKDDVERWTVEQVAAWLQQVELSDCCDSFLRRGIDGHRFLQLSEGDLFQWGRDVSLRNRTKILKLVSQIKSLQQHPSTTRQPNEVLRYLGSQPPRGQEMQLGQTENVQDEECIEDLYLQLLPDSPTDKHPNMLDSLPQPPVGRPLPPKTLSNGHHRREGPGNLHPSSKAVPSYRPGIESGGLNNGMRYIPQSPQRIQKGPPPLPEQSASQNKAPGTPPIPPRMTPGSSNKATCSTFPRTNSRQNNIHGPGSRPLETHNDDSLDGSGDSFCDGEETEKHSGQRIQPVERDIQGDGGIDSLYLEPLRSPATSPSPNNVRNSAPPIPDRIPKRFPPPTPDTLAAPLNKQRLPTKIQAITPRVPTHSPLQGSSSLGLAKSGSNGGQGGSFSHGQFASNTIPRWHTNKQSSPAHLPIQSSEPNDHEYETVDACQVPCWSNETPGPNMADQQSPNKPPIPPPRNQNLDSDDRDPSSRLGPTPLPPGKLLSAPLPPPTRSLPDGQSTQARLPDLPSRAERSRQPKALPPLSGASSHPSNETFIPKSRTPQPSKPTVTLGNGVSIEVTPLLQTIMEKPYFQFISRAKAKELVLQGGEGTFVIRPSTRTGNPLTITVKHNERSYNINIRQRPDGLFALGSEKASERTFPSIDEIVSAHYKEPITLEKGETAQLKFSPSKPHKSVYVQHVPGR